MVTDWSGSVRSPFFFLVFINLIIPGECVCEDGWIGPTCSQPQCSPGCRGTCRYSLTLLSQGSVCVYCVRKAGAALPAASPSAVLAVGNFQVQFNPIIPGECVFEEGWSGPTWSQPQCSPGCKRTCRYSLTLLSQGSVCVR